MTRIFRELCQQIYEIKLLPKSWTTSLVVIIIIIRGENYSKSKIKIKC